MKNEPNVFNAFFIACCILFALGQLGYIKIGKEHVPEYKHKSDRVLLWEMVNRGVCRHHSKGDYFKCVAPLEEEE